MTLQFLSQLPRVIPAQVDFDRTRDPHVKGLSASSVKRGTPYHGHKFFRFKDGEGRLVEDEHGRVTWALHPLAAQRIAEENGWTILSL